jgi:hypothetical protein
MLFIWKNRGGVICIHPNLREGYYNFLSYFIYYILLAGFLSLEEIDEAEYGLDIPDPENHDRKHNSKQDKKLDNQKQDGACSDGETTKDESIKSKVKKKKKKKNKDAKENQKAQHSNTGIFFLFNFKIYN